MALRPPGAGSSASGGLRVAFIHPDLGLGGAERLVVDAATELARAGHHVDLFTAYYDPARCFEETKTGGFAVRTAGGWFPRHILGRMHALCAYVRCVLVAIHIAWRCWTGALAPYDVVIADLVAVAVPVVKLLMPNTRVLFYCHFPDMLLTKRESALKKLYRAPLDWLEEGSTGAADLVLVNSRFTRGVFASTFTRLAARGLDPGVLYPAVPIPEEAALAAAEAAWRSELDPELAEFIAGGTTFLSINRFERKKGIGLALEALHELMVMRAGQGAGPPGGGETPAAAPGGGGAGASGRAGAGGDWSPRLVLAGGYDPRLSENVEHLAELREAAAVMDLRHVVRFVPSFTDRQRTLLLAACRAVLYTPQHEHFGIVPLEAMAAGRPVVAVRSGGPVESVAHGTVGFLCDPTAADFATAMQRLMDPRAAQAMGAAARAHVEASFSRRAFGAQLEKYVRRLVAGRGAADGVGEQKKGGRTAGGEEAKGKEL
ncbi:Alpha-1,3/1,6-mannosyltransferase ALG2 [Tetrabaena socialis]|uniref:Alpha-1,3/1,6-mannosyltransferase ALG2 n=1 Tax=Tetrabaena socialis TaxID=47790 RepID=A0A2J8A076_9CHLO|nr:Alpha-1,3/1,6-mannosyltransferase ALG2 [Tetrabaena socialis]|eukprot:PNH05927.1 Alpha-1,3/1,6-mannosyltransferase ALG2 [Tetrabaena socialis]